jgi:uncharacterized protein DUF2868
VRAADAAKILLVRAIEESEPATAVSPEADAAASAARGDAGELDWLLHRATHRLALDLAPYAPLLHLADAPHAPAWLFAIPFAVGLLSNWLGTTGQIHVLYNPIAVLVAWNLALYAALVAAPLVARAVRSRRTHAAPPAPAAPVARAAPARPRGARSWLLRRAAPTFFFRMRRDVERGAAGAAFAARVARRFWSLWIDAAGALPAGNVRRILHGGAAALAVGAVAGMLVRGVFFEYAMVWRSTFVRDPAVVADVLRIALGPASLVQGHALPTAADAERMMSAAGVPAAPWIALWVVTAGLFVLVPRAVLVAEATLRRRVRARRIELSLDDPYYEALLAGVRRAEIERIQGEIDGDVRAEIARLVASIGDFVCVRLYDERLVPQLRAFRETGGSVESLEHEMQLACESFQPELDAELDRARDALEAGLRAAVERTVGRSLGLAGAEGVAIRPGDLAVGALGGAVGREISTAVGAAVSTAVGLVLATVSGGFGHHLGAAVLVTLLHTTGPVGFLIGGLGGLAVAVTGWYLGRDRVAAGMRGVRLPRAVARIALRDGALRKLVAQGRAQCATAVREKLAAELEPLVPKLAEEIWAKLRPALPAARGRAAS